MRSFVFFLLLASISLADDFTNCSEKTLDGDERTRVSPQLVELLSKESSKEKTDAITRIAWIDLTEQDVVYLLKKAHLSQNSYEIMAFIALAKQTRDPRWKSVLTEWVRLWNGRTQGWQSYALAAARDTLDKLNVKVEIKVPETAYGQRYWDKVSRQDFKSIVTSDARKFIEAGKIFFTPHSLIRVKDHSITEEEVLEVLRSKVHSQVVSFEKVDPLRDSAVFRWVGQKEGGGPILKIIFSLSEERFTIITASHTSLGDVEIYMRPDYNQKTARTRFGSGLFGW